MVKIRYKAFPDLIEVWGGAQELAVMFWLSLRGGETPANLVFPQSPPPEAISRYPYIQRLLRGVFGKGKEV